MIPLITCEKNIGFNLQKNPLQISINQYTMRRFSQQPPEYLCKSFNALSKIERYNLVEQKISKNTGTDEALISNM